MVASPGALDPEQQGAVEREAELVARVRHAVDPHTLHAHLRVRSGGRERDLLLGDAARLEAVVPIVQWDTAPIAAVLFEARTGEGYAIEQEDRTLEGEVVARSLIEVDDAGLAMVATEDWVARRGSSGWVLVADVRPRWPDRSVSERRRRPSCGAVLLQQRARTVLTLQRRERLPFFDAEIACREVQRGPARRPSARAATPSRAGRREPRARSAVC